MKIMIRFVALSLTLLLISALCACSSGGSSETAAETSSAEQTDEKAAGEYKAFGMSYEEYPDYVIDASIYIDTVITLNEDGTGSYVTEDETYEIGSWKTEDSNITVDMDGVDTSGIVKDGIMILTYYDCSVYFAKDGADKSSVKLITADEFEEKLQELMPDDEAKDD